MTGCGINRDTAVESLADRRHIARSRSRQTSGQPEFWQIRLRASYAAVQPCPSGGIGAARSRALALSQEEFNRMVSDHGPAMYRMAYRMVGDCHEAEDVVQEA